MKVSEIYASAMTADYVADQNLVVTIAGGEIRDMGEGRKRIVLKFHEVPLPLVVNATNARALKAIIGDEVTTWTGKQITLCTEPCSFAGKPVRGIRVRRDDAPAAPTEYPVQTPTSPIIDDVVRF